MCSRSRRDHAENVRGQAIDSGHFIPEEAPDEAHRQLRDFSARASNLSIAYTVGRMFWFMRNRLVGSYLFFSATSRS